MPILLWTWLQILVFRALLCGSEGRYSIVICKVNISLQFHFSECALVTRAPPRPEDTLDMQNVGCWGHCSPSTGLLQGLRWSLHMLKSGTAWTTAHLPTSLFSPSGLVSYTVWSPGDKRAGGQVCLMPASRYRQTWRTSASSPLPRFPIPLRHVAVEVTASASPSVTGLACS